LKALEARYKINRYELFTVAIGEGLGYRFDSSASEKDFLNGTVSGYGELGTDVFGTELKQLRSLKLLGPDFVESVFPKNFEGQYATFFDKNPGDFFLQAEERAEAGDNYKPTTVVSAVFKNLRSGMIGFSAVYAHRQMMFLNDAASLGYKNPSADESAYWTYYYFQSPGSALSSLKNRGIAVRNLGTEPDGSRPKGIPMKCLKRVATMRHAMAKNSLDLSAKCNLKLFQNNFVPMEPVNSVNSIQPNSVPNAPVKIFVPEPKSEGFELPVVQPQNQNSGAPLNPAM
jgi:hypothetical protein